METISIGLLLASSGVLLLSPLFWGILNARKRKEQPPPSEENHWEEKSARQPGRKLTEPQWERANPKAAEHPFSFPRLLLLARWLLAPFYLGLVATVVLYMYKFALKLASLFLELPELTEKEVMLKVLYLVDIVMVANLLMYTAIGSFAYFVSAFTFACDHERPAMLGHLDATTLKLKLGMALIGVSSIHLLEAFMDIEQIGTEKVILLVAVHVVFVLSTIAIAWIHTLPNPGGQEHHS